MPQESHLVYIMAFFKELETYQPSFCLFTLSHNPPNLAGDGRNLANKLQRLQNNTLIQQDFFLEEIYTARVRVSKECLQPTQVLVCFNLLHMRRWQSWGYQLQLNKHNKCNTGRISLSTAKFQPNMLTLKSYQLKASGPSTRLRNPWRTVPTHPIPAETHN